MDSFSRQMIYWTIFSRKRDGELSIRQKELQLEHRHAQLKEQLSARLSCGSEFISNLMFYTNDKFFAYVFLCNCKQIYWNMGSTSNCIFFLSFISSFNMKIIIFSFISSQNWIKVHQMWRLKVQFWMKCWILSLNVLLCDQVNHNMAWIALKQM